MSTDQTAKAQSEPIMRRLRSHTAALHAATEDLPLMRGLMEATPAGYQRYLVHLRDVYAQVEPALLAALPASLLDTLGVRPKLAALQRDLVELSLPESPQPRHGTAARVHQALDAAAPQQVGFALGGLYVLEGATLGGQVIARRLKERWPGPPPTLNFLEFRTHHAAQDWRQFGMVLTNWARQHPQAEHAILDGARSVFEIMHEALADA